jgi:hypothetical protein
MDSKRMGLHRASGYSLHGGNPAGKGCFNRSPYVFSEVSVAFWWFGSEYNCIQKARSNNTAGLRDDAWVADVTGSVSWAAFSA